jgi:hypothetical protein
MIKKIIFLLVLSMSFSVSCQKNIFDKYQYIVVPIKFDFLKTEDQYQTSSLTKFLFKKKDFKVFLSNEKLPVVLNDNRCLALFVSIIDKSSMLTIKSTIVIKDCFGKILYTSKTGKSKRKDYKKGYHEAIRGAFDTMKDFKHNYKPVVLNESSDVTINKAGVSNKVKDTSAVQLISKEVLNDQIQTRKVTEKKVIKKSVAILYAQEIVNGFQLVNAKPEVVFIILKTNVKDVFVIKDKNGNFYKTGDRWFAEYYDETKRVKKEFRVKF